MHWSGCRSGRHPGGSASIDWGLSMCGRFTLHHTWAEVHEAMSILPAEDRGRNTTARYNITPMQDVLFVATGKDAHP